MTYHNVIPDALFDRSLHLGVSHRASVFRRQVEHISRRFRCSTSLDDAGSATITFDDGYRNQFEVARPILQTFGIRAIFFITLDLLHAQEPLWIDSMLAWVSYAPEGDYRLSADEETLELRISARERMKAWRQLYDFLRRHYPQRMDLLHEMDSRYQFAQIFGDLHVELHSLRFTPLCRQHLDEFMRDGHVIGIHSCSHDNLAQLDKTALTADIAACARAAENLGASLLFSYPFGGVREVSPEVIEALVASPFSHAVSNTNVPLPKGRRYSAAFIPRLALLDRADRAYLDVVLSGTDYFLRHRRLLPTWREKEDTNEHTLHNSGRRAAAST